ncbi:RNA 2',3'-cyclic phosphodiesterase [Thiolapillus brandeum]|uniref:RNA 2',3'-cyclic phosphodiesterase n=1 Tax=Thiolapillus brandeum TaxID=1076588 RepID=A0A7U6GJP5_9GAMM|nr:RNA 2',3'-cyclic phosphodiesterase [Thiolapillus brandeum]BAO44854.1 2'-5' RNA ligase [Thiolapillus brandeum]
MGSRNRRLFFALWPDDALRRELAALQTLLPQGQGNWVHGSDLHMTLQFLGAVRPDQQACVSQAAARVQGHSFELEITHLDYWARPRIAWAGPETTPPALLQLVADLGQNLESCGFKAEQRPYRPHVTLVRKTPPSGRIRLARPITWTVEHFALLESRPGGEPPWYHVVESWPLLP